MMIRQVSRKAIVSVINDLSTDQRVDRTCRVLLELGYDVTLVGRRLRNSNELEIRPYRTRRFQLLINSGPIFYLKFNIRLFLYLLFHQADLLWANDADTLLANGIASRLKRVKLIYDSHELFSEVPELKDSPLKRKIWRSIEDRFAPGADAIITVNGSIAAILEKRFGRRVAVVRNIPPRYLPHMPTTREALGLPDDRIILILQGSGINIDRGGEEMLEAMKHLNDFLLLVAGSGDVIPLLKKQSRDAGLDDRVRFIPRQAYSLLMQFTSVCDAGLSLDKDTNLNYRYSLPNKIFDYIQAGIPLITSNLPEVGKVVQTYGVGLILEDHNPVNMARQIREFFKASSQVEECRRNTSSAAIELCWENERQILADTVESIL